MASTSELVLRLRQDIGDNPLLEDGTTPDTTAQIWTNAEHLAQLNSALVTVFKGKRSSLESLNSFEDELVILEATIKLNYILAMDSSRYVKYKLRDVDVSKLSPSEFIQIAKALEQKKKQLLEESSDVEDVGNQVQQGIFRRYDKMHDAVVPTRYVKPLAIPSWSLSSSSTGVLINISYAFVDNYGSHFLKRMIGESGEDGTIVETWTVLTDIKHIDTDANVDDTEYRYRLYVEDTNGELFYEEKTVTYATP
jgi:hypothetical protein